MRFFLDGSKDLFKRTDFARPDAIRANFIAVTAGGVARSLATAALVATMILAAAGFGVRIQQCLGRTSHSRHDGVSRGSRASIAAYDPMEWRRDEMEIEERMMDIVEGPDKSTEETRAERSPPTDRMVKPQISLCLPRTSLLAYRLGLVGLTSQLVLTPWHQLADLQVPLPDPILTEEESGEDGVLLP